MDVRRTSIAAVLATAILLGPGCVEGLLRQTGPLGLIMLVFVGATPKAKASSVGKTKPMKFRDDSDVEFTGSFGGLSGTYSVDVGDYGTIEGVADIKGSFNAKIRDKELDEDVAAVVEAAVLDRFGIEIDVTKTKNKYNGKQTPGGVKKIFNGSVKFEGVVLSGENEGSRVKGKMSAKGKFE